MRTKTLLLAAGVIAAGIASSQAQSNVYSQNIVGYVQLVSTGGVFNLIENPLDDGTNTLSDLIPSPAVGSIAESFNGASFVEAKYKASGWTTNLLLYPGTGFFLQYNTNIVITNTFVGNVVVNAGKNANDGLGTNNSAVPNGFTLQGSVFPISDSLTGTNINLSACLTNVGDIVETFNGASFVEAKLKASGWTTNLPIAVGQSFFIDNLGSPTNWTQTLP